jgi:dolichyl-phosphate beta-glucosyltransferase
MTLSIVIPAFDERRKIARDVETATRFLEDHGLSGEVIVVDDGSSDGTAQAALQSSDLAGAQVKVITGNPHRGKGFAVRTGVLSSSGDFVMFADCGVTVPFENALRGLRLLREGTCHLAHGSRRLPVSTIWRDQDWDRKLISRLFHYITMRAMHLPRNLTDTQCGFKMYVGSVARELYKECFTNGFLFDIEIIMRAQGKGLRVLEFPVEWTCDRDSRISVAASSVQVINELLTLRRKLLTRR